MPRNVEILRFVVNLVQNDGNFMRKERNVTVETPGVRTMTASVLSASDAQSRTTTMIHESSAAQSATTVLFGCESELRNSQVRSKTPVYA